jgi:multicomponent Na+:H+ antiporter subunit F
MSPAFQTVLHITNILLFISLVLTTIRLMRGPSLPDRAIAGDQVALHVVAFGLVHAITTQQALLIDILIITAIVGFLSLSIVGIYMERSERGQARSHQEEEL